MIEVLLAMTISSLLIVSIVGTTRALSDARDGINRRSDRLLEARHGLATIAAALQNIRRDPAINEHLIIGTRGGGNSGNDHINLLMISERQARSDSPETDQYSMDFYLTKSSNRRYPTLMCRKNNALAEHPEKGGIASVVAEGIAGLSFKYFTGSQWQNEWSDLEPKPPLAVRVSVLAIETTAQNSKTPPDVIELSTIVPIRVNIPTELPQSNSPQTEKSGGVKR